MRRSLHSRVEAESERTLSGEDAPLTRADFHGRLSPGVAGCNVTEWLHGYCAEQGVGAMSDTAHR